MTGSRKGATEGAMAIAEVLAAAGGAGVGEVLHLRVASVEVVGAEATVEVAAAAVGLLPGLESHRGRQEISEISPTRAQARG